MSTGIYFWKIKPRIVNDKLDFQVQRYNNEERDFLIAKNQIQKSITWIALHGIAALVGSLYSLAPDLDTKITILDGVLKLDKRKTDIVALALVITAIAHAYFHFRNNSPKSLQLKALQNLSRVQLGDNEYTLFLDKDLTKIYYFDRNTSEVYALSKVKPKLDQNPNLAFKELVLKA